jgi:GDP-4-dehydro-6-deoxy-D-mannose reductase
MRVFVTGASGFVGRRLMPRLEQAGFEATGADREVDVTDPECLARVVEKQSPDAILHLAAMSSPAESWSAPERCYRVNFLGTLNLLRAVAAHRPDARLLVIGSADQYAAAPVDSRPFDESTPLCPSSPYARTKAAAEMLAEEAATAGLDVVRIRAFNHTGAGQPDHFVASSFARQVAEIRTGRQAPRMRVGNLDSVRDFLHVEDVLEAYLRLLDPAVPADVYNVASGRATTIRALLDTLIGIAEIECEIETDPARWRETDWRVGDASRLRERTGWEPRIGVEETLRELYESWLEPGAVA